MKERIADFAARQILVEAERLLRAIQKCRILVVGDLMLDEYHRGHVERISPEAPVPVLNVISRDATLGGAGNVVRNLRSLNAGVRVVGLLGDDATAEQILKALAALGVTACGMVRDASRVSTRKVRCSQPAPVSWPPQTR